MKKRPITNSPVVLLDMSQNDYMIPFLVDIAREHDWRFFDLGLTNGAIPSGLDIMGAISTSLPDSSLCRNLRTRGCPVVRIGRQPHPLDHLQPLVMADMVAAGELAAEHFCSRGFKNLGYIGQTPWSNAKNMYDSFLKTSNILKSDVHLFRFPDYGPSNQQTENYRQNKHNAWEGELKKWLQTVPKPVGILTYNHKLAAWIDLICKSVGLSVPGEISLLCYKDLPGCEMTYTPISAIDIGLKSLAENAVRLLQDILNGKPPADPRLVVPPTGVVLRQSTDILAVSDPAVAKALSFIWENMALPLSVEDVADAAGVPLRTLVRSFKQCLGRTINQELRRKRLEVACDMLRNTSLTVSDITTKVGFSSKAYFHKRFHQEFGMTPQTFRMSHT